MAGSYALILTGEVLPGFAPGDVWPQLAAWSGIEPQRLAQLVARAPRVVKQSDDTGKLQRLKAGMAKRGAETQICLAGEPPALYALISDMPRGPVPLNFVQERISQGLWAESILVCAVGSRHWHPYDQAVEASVTAPPLLKPETVAKLAKSASAAKRSPLRWATAAVVLVAALAIAAAIALPAYQDGPIRAKVTQILALADPLERQVNGQGCDTGSRAPFDPAIAQIGMQAGRAGRCTIELTFARSAGVPAPLQGGQITLARGEDGLWACASGLPGKYLPPNCRRPA